MGRFLSSVPDLHHSVAATGGGLIAGLTEAGFRGNRLSATITEGLSEKDYQEVARQLRLIYAFAYRTVYSESYQLSAADSGFHFTGQDERKAHLLARSQHPEPKFLGVSDGVFADLIKLPGPKRGKIKLFNLLYVWTRAQELQLLHLPLEAQVLLGKIVDDMHRDGPELKKGKLMKGFGIVQTAADQFAVRILQELGRDDKPSAKEELEGFSYLYRLRQRQAEVLSIDTAYYLGGKAHADIERKNAFLFEITRLYVLWSFGLGDYHLNQQGSLYRISRSKR